MRYRYVEYMKWLRCLRLINNVSGVHQAQDCYRGNMLLDGRAHLVHLIVKRACDIIQVALGGEN